MLLTRNMEIQNGVLCLEPITNKMSKTTSPFFIPCNSSPEQKWTFLKDKENNEKGQIVHQKSGRCLSFNKVREKAEDTKRNKIKMLSFLSNIVNEIGLTIETPSLEHCEQDRNSNRYQTQIWTIDTPANFQNEL